jgi:hypothetical protein
MAAHERHSPHQIARGGRARSCECYQVVKTEFDRLLPYAAK